MPPHRQTAAAARGAFPASGEAPGRSMRPPLPLANPLPQRVLIAPLPPPSFATPSPPPQGAKITGADFTDVLLRKDVQAYLCSRAGEAGRGATGGAAASSSGAAARESGGVPARRQLPGCGLFDTRTSHPPPLQMAPTPRRASTRASRCCAPETWTPHARGSAPGAATSLSAGCTLAAPRSLLEPGMASPQRGPGPVTRCSPG